MSRKFTFLLAAAAAIAAPASTPAFAQETLAAEPGAPVAGEAPAINEDEMADLLNSQQQIKQDVTLTRTVDGKVVETKKETIVYAKDDPLRGSEAGLSPIEKLVAEFASQAITRKEALDEAKLDFVLADLDRDGAMTSDEFVYLVKGWEDAEITGSGSGSGRFVEPYFHVDAQSAAAEHADLARAKFSAMAGAAPALSKKAFTRRVVAEFEQYDANKDDLLQGDELLNFRASVRGEPILGEYSE